MIVLSSDHIDYDVCVIGGGAGGFAAALFAARSGAKTVIIEQQPILGGTSTSAYVNNWEPGPGCSLARELFERLSAVPGRIACAGNGHCWMADEPYNIRYGTKDLEVSYEATLRRTGISPDKWCSVIFRPEEMAEAMMTMLQEAGVRVLLNTSFVEAEAGNAIVRTIRIRNDGDSKFGAKGEDILVHARVFIDSTGDACLCRAIECEMMLGAEPRSQFKEASAPEEAEHFLNAISLCYRIRKSCSPRRQPPPAEAEYFPQVAFTYGVTEDELYINPLPLVEGMMLVDKGLLETMQTARRRVLAHWHWLQPHPHFRDYEIADMAPMPGIRESWRTVTDYILTETDARVGLSQQKHPDIIAIADHALDVHGGSTGARELAEPYGIPYRCLLPKGWDNVLVACRGAGFSHIAASSCRLTRTIMALGRAAGLAAAKAARDGKGVRDVDVPTTE